LNSHLEFGELNIATGLDCLIFSESSLKTIKTKTFCFFFNFRPERRIQRVKA